MRKTTKALLCLPVIVSTLCHATGIQIGRTRIIYDATKKEVALPLQNNDKELPWLIQSWTDTGDGKTRGPFIVTPPLFRLDPQKEQSLRITWNGAALPGDKESLFYMNVRTVPATATDDANKNVLRLIYKTRLKMFWRPAGLDGSPSESCKNLRFVRHDRQLTAINAGAFYSVFDSLTLGGKKIEKADMVSPKSSVDIPLPESVQGTSVSWRCITDYGNASEKYTSTLTQD
ncbi:fimbrial biogenesis chaperone [Enterobacter huaxiensis]|uniref:Molecular chaperone n=1 Tax=Enterobacter huaxiensis TaxID=2494702 RepID=A0ABU6EIS1_9ENTR|nr:molecular chaperone [Enterobacter huaxiensis]MCS5449908.1 molecular chaperone [Enterobacter huaxiensis]MEB7540946.1 molecular chaperone [Enterobacter huaxiensis]MEB7579841.1 molecular chaperone [Enterobacter huaxiensis]MEB7661961.1 molecular chaperone [Enterobacter huaxiensis]